MNALIMMAMRAWIGRQNSRDVGAKGRMAKCVDMNLKVRCERWVVEERV